MAFSLWRDQDFFGFTFEWHLPAMAQFEQLHPQELFPAFLSRIITTIASAMIPATASKIRMLAMLL
jgi:hypothetical protein